MESDEIWTPQEPRIIEAKEALMTDNQLASQAKYRHKCAGIVTAPFACLVRDYGSFGVVMLVQDVHSSDLLVDRWLCHGVSEAEARAALERAK